MATMAAEAVFVDTNVLVYANWNGAARHLEARQRLASVTAAGHAVGISRQILREFLAVVTRPQGDVTPMSVSEAVETVQALASLFSTTEENELVGDALLDLVSRYGVKGRVVHDANIVATMSVLGVRRILTANPADFRRFADIIDIEPL